MANGKRRGNGNGDPLLVRRFVLGPAEAYDAGEEAHTWPAPAHDEPGGDTEAADLPVAGRTPPGIAPADFPEGRHIPAHRASRFRRADEGAGPRRAETAGGAAGAAAFGAAQPGTSTPGTLVPARRSALEPTAIKSTAVVLPGSPAEDVADNRPSRRRVLLLAGLVVAVAIALAATGLAVLNGNERGPRALPTPSGLTGGPESGTPSGSPPGSAPMPNQRQPNGIPQIGPAPENTRAGGATANGGLTAGGVQAPETATADVSPAALDRTAQSSPPAQTRTGTIRTGNDRCLALPGGKPRDHQKYAMVYPCDGTEGQWWTLGSDGTIRLGGKCALAEGSVLRVSGCGHRAQAQWRAGSGGIVLNVSTGQCLTDAGETTVARCTGGTNQRWSLP